MEKTEELFWHKPGQSIVKFDQYSESEGIVVAGDYATLRCIVPFSVGDRFELRGFNYAVCDPKRIVILEG